MIHQTNQPLIVGAGPVGLGAALFLARQGRPCRVVEMRCEPSRHSKALAVNPRTLEILKPTGVTERMLELGMPIRGVQLHRGTTVAASLSLSKIHTKYPFMLALSQATTERLLEDALKDVGGKVERGIKLKGCRPMSDEVEAELEFSENGPEEFVRCPWMLAADGAHSVAREHLKIDFPGTTFSDEWHLTDVVLRTNLASDHAHVFFLADGVFLFMVRVIDPALADQIDGPIWRVMGNRPEPLSYLIGAEPAGKPVWTSSFRIAHRINATMAMRNIYFAGDAAHLHSPVGARGMNLGLEDVWVLSELVRTNSMSAYNSLRRPVDERVVRRVEMFSRFISSKSIFVQLGRDWLLPVAVQMPFVRARMLRTVDGLDHQLRTTVNRVADGEHEVHNTGRALADRRSKTQLQAIGGQSTGALAAGATAVGAMSLGALAIGVLAFGALAIGALAIGRLAIGRLAIGWGKIDSLNLNQLNVKSLRIGKLQITESLEMPNVQLPISRPT